MCPFQVKDEQGQPCGCQKSIPSQTSLASLPVGQSSLVRYVCSKNVALFHKLASYGVTQGASVKMIGSAPLGDPIRVEVRGFVLSLRKSEADMVELEGPTAKEVE
jgi:ferrous iron transport protein A